MEVKAWMCLTGELVYHRLTNKEQIKAIIRICGQSEHLMVVTQLQALLCVSQGYHGKKLYLNFNKLRDKLTFGVQDLFTMLIINEEVLAKRIGPHNITTYKQVMTLTQNNSTDQIVKHKVLAVVQQFEIETELLRHHGELMMKIVYGNKHLSMQ